MATVLTINSAAVAVPAAVVIRRLLAFSRGAIPTLEFETRGGPVPVPPYPYLGKTCRLAVNGTRYFDGDVTRADPEYRDHLGWCISYTALGLRNRLDWFPNTDDNTNLDASGYNLQPEDPLYFASRAGRTVGQILTAVLTATTNGTALNAAGLCAYTSTAPFTLPSATVADLAALAIIPPAPVWPGGEKLGGALEAFLCQWAPNHCLWVDPRDGTLRFLDTRAFPSHTFTLGTDPVEPTPLSRDTGDCFQRCVVRGQHLALPVYADVLQTGLLAEDFAHDGLTNAAAKAAWKDSVDFQRSLSAQDQGTCTCPSTTTVTVTSADATRTWPANFWDATSTGRHGWVHVSYGVGGGTAVVNYFSAPIVSNTALTAGGTSTLTLGNPLPNLLYTKYQIFGFSGGSSVVWRRYSITNPAVAAALANQFTSPVPYVLASGGAATLTSYPQGSVLWSSSGSPPCQETPAQFTADPVAGTILFVRPTWEHGRNAPYNVRALLAVNNGPNSATQPPDSGGPVYQGTSYTVDGLSRTLTVTVDQWRDPANLTAMLAYAQEILDSVKDAVIEGEIVYRGLYEPALLMGTAALVAGTGYTTGWEGPLSSFGGFGGLPVLGCELRWHSGAGRHYTTVLHCSNRRAALSSGAFLKPDRVGVALGGEFSPFETPDALAASAALFDAGAALGDYAAGLAGPADEDPLGSFFAGTGSLGSRPGTDEARSGTPTAEEHEAAQARRAEEHEAALERRAERDREDSIRRNEAFGKTTHGEGFDF